MEPDDRKWTASWLGGLVGAAIVPAVLLLGPLQNVGNNAARLSAVLAFVGVMVTAAVSFIGATLTRQSNRRLQQEHADQETRLRLDAAMRAGGLFSPEGSGTVDPASVASSLLALTRLDQADLAVAVLVDFWAAGSERVSAETAILVIDSALRSGRPNAQLVAAELLCRNATRLDPCQSLHWPSVIDGCWNPDFGPKTKLLLVEALILMTLSRIVSENALRSVAVRMYGIWDGDPDKRIKGCVGKLIEAIVPPLKSLGYTDFMQGNQKVMLGQLEEAAATATDNPDDFLNRLVEDRSEKLLEWAGRCTRNSLELRDGALADAAGNPAAA